MFLSPLIIRSSEKEEEEEEETEECQIFLAWKDDIQGIIASSSPSPLISLPVFFLPRNCFVFERSFVN